MTQTSPHPLDCEIMVNGQLTTLRQIQIEKNLKVYVSGKIGNDPDGARVRFAEAERYLAELGFTVVNPFHLDHSGHDGSWRAHMNVDIKALVECDCIYLLPCWTRSPGAIVEHNLAAGLNIVRIFAEKGGAHGGI